jgi:hypothetical protein
LGLAFFGLTFDIAPQARAAIFTQVHEICFHGKGGYDWNTVYNMPIWLRRFVFNQIQEHYKNEKQQMDKARSGGKQKSLIDSSGNVNKEAWSGVPKPISPASKLKTSYR